jgi:hypothetical protein
MTTGCFIQKGDQVYTATSSSIPAYGGYGVEIIDIDAGTYYFEYPTALQLGTKKMPAIFSISSVLWPAFLDVSAAAKSWIGFTSHPAVRILENTNLISQFKQKIH